MTEREKEEEKERPSERSRASTRVRRAHGSAPELISITLTAQTYITPRGEESKRDTQLLSRRCGGFDHSLIRFDPPCRCFTIFRPDLER